MNFKFYLAVICLALLSLTACKDKPKEEAPTAFVLSDTMLKRCEFTKVRMEDVKSQLKLFGKVEADNNKMAHVYPITGGIVAQINVELGDHVNEGQLLARYCLIIAVAFNTREMGLVVGSSGSGTFRTIPYRNKSMLT